MEREHNLNTEDEMEIDLLELFRAWKKKLWLIILVTVIGGAIGFGFSKLALTPQYTSTSMVYVLSKETTLTSLADLQIGSQLTQDYMVITTSRPVLDEVNRSLELGLTYEELRGKITLDNPSNTRILSITATDPDPRRAKEIADSVAQTSSGYIGDIMEMIPPKIIEEGQVATVKSSPSNTKNGLIGAFLGLALTCGIIALQTILNDTIRTEEDVNRYLGLTVLASVPKRSGEDDFDGDESEKSREKRRRKEEHRQAEREFQTAGRSRKRGRKG